uniref:Putative thyroid transcription factor 1-associated protein 26 n=1 Tax=Anopheles marajoara TaxID=58244 RepID=A0A2M4BXL2_9DIPT
MKSNNDRPQGKNGPPGRNKGGQKSGKPWQGKGKSFFRDVPEGERKSFRSRGDEANAGSGSKRGGVPGVRRNSHFFKQKPNAHQHKSGGHGVNQHGKGHNKNFSKTNPNDRTKDGGRNQPFNGNKKPQNTQQRSRDDRPGGGRGNRKEGHRPTEHRSERSAPSTLQQPNGAEQLFSCKPEKLHYCLAPERLEAQAHASKHFERLEREKEFQRRKEERKRNHQLMTKKTRKGQPVMQGRMELLFEKIQKSMGSA